MSTVNFMGREYNTNDLLKEVVAMAKMLAINARLIDPLPVNVDLSQAEHKEVQDQVRNLILSRHQWPTLL